MLRTMENLRLPFGNVELDDLQVAHCSQVPRIWRMARRGRLAGYQELPWRRQFRALAVIAMAAALCNCTPVMQLDNWSVAPGAACASLSTVFPVERSTLQSIVGPNLSPAEFGEQRAGRLRLSVYSCPDTTVSGRREASSGFAIATVPVKKDNAPIALAGMGEADWSSLVLYVGSGSGSLWQLMQASSFAVMRGESRLSRLPARNGEQITASIALEEGTVSITARFACEPKPVRRGQVNIGTGSRRYSVLFGERSGKQCDASDVALHLSGETPFSDLDLTADEATASQLVETSWSYKTLRNAQF